MAGGAKDGHMGLDRILFSAGAKMKVVPRDHLHLCARTKKDTIQSHMPILGSSRHKSIE